MTEKDPQEVPFRVIKEEWNEYTLDDGRKLKLKGSPASFLKLDQTDPSGKPLIQVKLKLIYDLTPPAPPNEIKDIPPGTEIKFTIDREPMNIYGNEELVVILVVHLLKIVKTDQVEPGTHNPIYGWTIKTAIGRVQYPDLKSLNEGA